MADKQADDILQKYSQARDYVEQTLAQEAEEKIARNQRLQAENDEKIEKYDRAVSGINTCLQAMQLYESLLPAIGQNNDVLREFEAKDTD